MQQLLQHRAHLLEVLILVLLEPIQVQILIITQILRAATQPVILQAQAIAVRRAVLVVVTQVVRLVAVVTLAVASVEDVDNGKLIIDN